MLILALIYLVAVGMIVAALANWAMNDLNNTSKFASAQTLQNAASNATEVAIQNIRYTPLLSTDQTVNANPPTYCWGSGPVSRLTSQYVSGGATNSVTMAVWCSTLWNPTSQTSRVVTFYTCLSTVNSAACRQNPLLQVVVNFDDYPSGVSSAPIQGPCSVFCGQGITVVSWIWGSSTNSSVSGIATSATFSTEPSSTTVGAVTSAAVTVLDAAGDPVVGDTVTILKNSGPGTLTGTLNATTNTSGIAIFTNLVLSAVGRDTLTAIDGTVSVNSTSFTVGKGANSITGISAAPSATVGGATYTPSATATSGDTPVITVDSSSSGVCTISGSGVVSFSAVGTCTLNFNDAGNANYVAANQVQQSFSVGKRPGVITITSTAPPSATVGGATYHATATATSGDAVTITSGTASVCTISSGVVSFSAVGTCTLNFNDVGNANYGPATQVQQSFTVGKGANSITGISAAPSATVGGATYTPSATATSGDTPVITVDSSSSGVCTISGSGVVSFIAVGTCTLNFNDAGNVNYVAANQVQQSFSVGLHANSITFTSTNPTPVTVSSAPYTPTATATSGLPVTITLDASSTGCSISGGGVVSFTAVGTCIVDANQAGNANYGAAPQVQQSIAVTTRGAKQVTGASATQSNNGGSITSGTFTADSGSKVLILVTYQDGGNQTCSSASVVTGTPLTSISSVIRQGVWWTGSGDYGMCAFSATGAGTSGTVRVTFSGNTQNAEIQLVEITGDNNATIGVSGYTSGSSTTPAVTLAGLTAGSSEIFFGDAANGTSTVPTWNTMSGFAQVGSTQTGTASPTANAFSSAVFLGSAASSVTGSIAASSHWGTIGIEIKP